MSNKHCPIKKRDCMDCCAWYIVGECAVTIIAESMLHDVSLCPLGEAYKRSVEPNKCDLESVEEDREIQDWGG